MDIHAEGSIDTPGDREEEAMDIEAPEADSVEQHRPLRETGDEPARTTPLDVDEADAADQSRVIELDEDEYR
jgi:hypothetical protein